MITANHSSSQCLDCHHFSRFDCDARTYAAEADSENSDHSSEEEQTYHTVNNNNDSEDFDSEKNNLTINFALSEPL